VRAEHRQLRTAVPIRRSARLGLDDTGRLRFVGVGGQYAGLDQDHLRVADRRTVAGDGTGLHTGRVADPQRVRAGALNSFGY
jgi:hypothetical protein